MSGDKAATFDIAVQLEKGYSKMRDGLADSQVRLKGEARDVCLVLNAYLERLEDFSDYARVQKILSDKARALEAGENDGLLADLLTHRNHGPYWATCALTPDTSASKYYHFCII